MRVAVIGAGLSGLAVTWFILNNRSFEKPPSVTIYDSKGIGEGTSGMAAGLLHPFAGASAKLNPFGWEGYKATCKLLEVSSQTLGMPVATFSGVQRIAITERQKEEYQKCAQLHKEVVWMESINLDTDSNYPGLFIPSAITVDCPLYLQGLWLACQKKGAIFIHQEIGSLEDLKDYDKIILATGAFVNNLLIEKLPVTQVKGQILEMSWPSSLRPLRTAVNSIAYVLMSSSNQCIVGSTYERNFTSLDPNVTFAKEDILPKVYPFLPSLKQSTVLNCRAGVRASTPNHLPIIKQLDNRCWVITGMGSKGLLYHALFAEKLVSELPGLRALDRGKTLIANLE